MAPPSGHERFVDLTSALSPREWRWLGAIAAEQVLGESVLARMSAPAPDPPEAAPADPGAALRRWLTESVASGLLVAVGPTRAPSLTSSPPRDAAFSLHPDHEQLVLRELAACDLLDDVAHETGSLLGARSVSALAAALQNADLRRFLERHATPRLPGQAPERTAAEWLRLTLTAPFDAMWLQRTWRSQTTSVATRVLQESLDGPSPCNDLLAWTTDRLPGMDSAQERLAVEATLCQHAIARGRVEQVEGLAARLPRETALGYRAAARFLEGDLAAAQNLLDEAFGAALRPGSSARAGSASARGATPQCAAIAPLLALLLLSRDTPLATAAAKRLFSASSASSPSPESAGERGAARAFRTLLRYLAEPEIHHRRIDYHQLDANAGAWEILLSALTVHLHLEQSSTRASWAQNLARKAVSWQQSGYAWLGKQGLLLANDLSPEYCLQELARHGLDAAALVCRPRELSLWELVAPKPEWQKTLQALAQVAGTVTESTDVGHRVAWFMDMRDGSFARPALQQYRVSAGGWSQGQRLTLAELHQHESTLPPEDVRVLRCTQETLDGRREPTPEAHEMLIGHPRVFNGMRGMAAVEVVRGSCRVETRDDGGYIRVVVEPEGAELGVNVVPQSETRLVIYRVTPAMRRVIEVLPRGIRIPKAHEPELLQVLGTLAQSVEVRSPQLGAEQTAPSDSTPCVRIAPQSGAWVVQLGIRPFGAKGRFFIAGLGRASVTLHDGNKRLRCDRDFERERERVDQLIAECPALHRDPEDHAETREDQEDCRWVFGEATLLALLAELRDATTPHELEWPESAALRLRGTVTSKNLHGRLRTLKGWYLATGGVRIDEVTEASLSELAQAPTLSGGRFLRLASGDYLEIESKIRRVVAALGAITNGKPKATEVRIHPAAVTTLQEIASPESGFDVDAAAKDWLERVADLPRKTFPVPLTLKAELRPYQVEGFRWLCRLAELGLGACLADDMGLGKTLQILALLLTRTTQGPTLVVAPTSVCANWALEIRRFAPTLTPVEYVGDSRAATLAKLANAAPGQVVICSYALLQQDEAQLTEISWDTVVLDEAQFIKNSESLRAKAACRLAARQRIAATGTPVENHFGDLWSIFQFLNPGLLGDWGSFNRRFVKSMEREDGPAAQLALRELVKPYVLRRLKRDVLAELPPVTEVRHDVHLSTDDATRYALLRKQIHEKLFTSHGKRQNKIEVLAEITRLRRFCCHPRLVFPDADSESAKVQSLLELVEELRENQHRALVFSQYVDFLGLVREQLDERAIAYEYLDGGTPRAQRQARIDAFQNGSASLFLISLKAGGFGLNLTAADYVIHLDPWWNPAVEAQATDRAHRIGQDRRVTVYRLVTRNTIEEKIMELHGKKQKLARSLLDGGDEAAKLSSEELVRLIEGDG